MKTHIRTISDSILLKASYENGVKVPAFIKPGETAKKAIQRLMANRQREIKTCQRNFPRWQPKMSIADYVAQFESMNALHRSSTVHLEDVFMTMPEGDECIVESI